jgi:hypothetical protein
MTRPISRKSRGLHARKCPVNPPTTQASAEAVRGRLRRLYPSVPLEFVRNTCLGLSQGLSQVSARWRPPLAHVRRWCRRSEGSLLAGVWKLNWAGLHNRHFAIVELASWPALAILRRFS